MAKGLIHYGLPGRCRGIQCAELYDWDRPTRRSWRGGVLGQRHLRQLISAEQIRNIVNNLMPGLLIGDTTRKKADVGRRRVPVPGAHHHHRDRRWLGRDQGLRRTTVSTRSWTSASIPGQEDRPLVFHRVHLRSHRKSAERRGDDPRALLPDRAESAGLRPICTTRNTIPVPVPPQAHSRPAPSSSVSSNVRIYIATGIKTLISDPQAAKPTHDRGAARAGEGVQRRVPEGRPRPQGRGVPPAVWPQELEYEAEVSASRQGRCTDPHSPALPSIRLSTCAKCSAVAPSGLYGGAPLDPEPAGPSAARVPGIRGRHGSTETTYCAFNPLGRRSTLVPVGIGIRFSCASPRTAKFRSRVVPCSGRHRRRTTRPLSCRSPKMAMSPRLGPYRQRWLPVHHRS